MAPIMLRLGDSIVNEITRFPGSCGCFARDVGGARWLVSCRHVLVRPQGWGAEPFAAGESILADSASVAVTEGGGDSALDVAAARLDAAVQIDPTLSGRGALHGTAADPVEGMEVVKIGAATGETSGIVRKVFTDSIRIVPRPEDDDPGFELTLPGDSGAVWFEAQSLRPVAIHRRGNESGHGEFSIATRFDLAMRSLGLELIV